MDAPKGLAGRLASFTALSNPSSPSRSYTLRFSWSLRISYACATSWNLEAASGSPWFLSALMHHTAASQHVVGQRHVRVRHTDASTCVNAPSRPSATSSTAEPTQGSGGGPGVGVHAVAWHDTCAGSEAVASASPQRTRVVLQAKLAVGALDLASSRILGYTQHWRHSVPHPATRQTARVRCPHG